MCRLFAMSGGERPVSARVWLIEAPDSLEDQSHHNPDGTGLGIFDPDGRPVLHKQPIEAARDRAFVHEAKADTSKTFLAHIRFASTGAKTRENTHPFEQDGRIFAHNGVLGGLEQIEQELGPDAGDLLRGQTDSERLFAIITHQTRANGGDLRAGIVSAVEWLAENVPIFSINLIIATPDELYALRYPESNELYVLERDGDTSGDLHHRSELGMHVHVPEAPGRPIVVISSEPMDSDPRWRPLAPGELIHVTSDLAVHSQLAFPDPPAHKLELHHLDPKAQASQSGQSAAQA